MMMAPDEDEPVSDEDRQALDEGVFESDHWLDFARDPRPGFQPPYWTRDLGRDRLETLLAQAYKSFYLRPRYILKQLARVRSWHELRDKAKAMQGQAAQMDARRALILKRISLLATLVKKPATQPAKKAAAKKAAPAKKAAMKPAPKPAAKPAAKKTASRLRVSPGLEAI